MDLIMLKKAQDDRKNTLPFIDSMDQLILTSITTLRRIATNLRPRALDEGGLFFALKSLQKEFREHHGIDCDLHANEHDLVLNDDISTTVYRVIQESLTNVARHAQANRVSIQLEQLENQLHFKIQDNGQGIASYDFLKNQSFGLIGMRERVLALNGQLLITANADNGTCIEVTLPLTM
jgi:signal transduction histidine kinase